MGKGKGATILVGRLMAWLGVCLISFAAQVAAASTLESINSIDLPNNKLQLQLTFDGALPKTKGYSIEKPARIVIDMPGASSELGSRYHDMGGGNVRSVTAVEARDRVRMIIDLTRQQPYKIERKGKQLLVTLGESGASDNPKSAVNVSSENGKVQVKKVDFHRSPEGGGDVVIDLSRRNVKVDVTRNSNHVNVFFDHVTLPRELHRRLDVADFGSAVQTIDAKPKGDGTMITVTANGDWEYLAYQADSQFTLNVKQKDATGSNAPEQAFEYTGKKLTLDFQDIEVRSVLQLIADFNDLNLVASDSIQGNITLKLDNVPWDQALDLILKTKGLAKREKGNVLMVAPASELATREQEALQNAQKREELEPLQTDLIRVNYAKAKEFATLLKTKDSFLSDRGVVSVDDRTNTLIIQDTEKRIETVRNLIATLDVPVEQVLIEARVLIASTNVANSIGVRWGGLGIVNKAGGSDRIIASSSAEDVTGNAQTASVIPTDGMVVDLGVADAGASRFSLGYFSASSGLLELELSALDSEGKAHLVATPKVLTADQQTAIISSGKEIPYSTSSANTGTNVEFKEAELKLEVTPHITPDGRVIMDIKVNDDSQGSAASNGEPTIDTNRVETTVLVDNAETVVLGGIFQRQKVNSVIKTPFLGDIPWLGTLFRRKVNSDQKQQLLIFITPKVIEQRQ